MSIEEGDPLAVYRAVNYYKSGCSFCSKPRSIELVEIPNLGPPSASGEEIEVRYGPNHSSDDGPLTSGELAAQHPCFACGSTMWECNCVWDAGVGEGAKLEGKRKRVWKLGKDILRKFKPLRKGPDDKDKPARGGLLRRMSTKLRGN